VYPTSLCAVEHVKTRSVDGASNSSRLPRPSSRLCPPLPVPPWRASKSSCPPPRPEFAGAPPPGPASLSPPSPSSSSAFYYSSPLISFWLLLVGSLLASCENPPHPQGDDTHTERGKGRRGRGRQPQWARHKRSGGRTHARDSPEIQDPRDPLALVASQSPERIRVHGGRRGARRVL
jgi:hypothetical protein